MRFVSDILFVASEMVPFSKSGGLGDVMGILPLTLKRMGHSVAVITPLYGKIDVPRHQIRLLLENCPVGYPWPDSTADLYVTEMEGMPVYFIDRPEYFDRKNYYCRPTGDYFDNCERFIFFCRATMAAMRRLNGGAPRIVHVHDWHAALTAAFIHFTRRADPYWQDTSTLLTIHNLAFQGQYAYRLFEGSGLPLEAWHMDGAEFYASFNMLKAGIAYADAISTVSPHHAREILDPEFGFGLEGILAKRKAELTGILNGADYSIWTPECNPALYSSYSAADLCGKYECKVRMLQEFMLAPELVCRPVLGFVGRLRGQKGVDVLIKAIPELVRRGFGLVVLGEGKPEYEEELQNIMERYPGRVSVSVGYTEKLSHMILAGTDMFLMPSRYEPCGLTQMYALRFGSVPIAHAVGGLVDTIRPYPAEGSTGFLFTELTPEGLLEATDGALAVWEDTAAWTALMRRAMLADFSWEVSAKRYISLYESQGYVSP